MCSVYISLHIYSIIWYGYKYHNQKSGYFQVESSFIKSILLFSSFLFWNWSQRNFLGKCLKSLIYQYISDISVILSTVKVLFCFVFPIVWNENRVSVSEILFTRIPLSGKLKSKDLFYRVDIFKSLTAPVLRWRIQNYQDLELPESSPDETKQNKTKHCIES